MPWWVWVAIEREIAGDMDLMVEMGKMRDAN